MDVQDQELSDEYLSSLVDLTVNSKLLIDMLTTLAHENIGRGPVIVETVAQHIDKVAPDYKLPVLYLIDSILKNVGGEYKTLFSHAIVNIFCGTFEKVNEKIRHKMYLLRQTWSNDIFPASKLYMLDVKAHRIDGNWPIAPVPKPAIHVNPNFLKTKPDDEMQNQLHQKERELLELKKRKIELELFATQKHIEEQEKALNMHTNCMIPGVPATVRMNQMAPLLCTPQMRPRIAPVNSALIASVRMRDPRIARLMHPQGPAQQSPRFPNAQHHSYGPRQLIQVAPETSIPTARPKISVYQKIDKHSSSDTTGSRGSSSSASRTDRKDSKKSPRRSGDSKKMSPRKSDSSRKSLAADAKVSSTSDIEAKDSPIRASPVPSAKLVRKQSASPPPPPAVSRISHEVISVKVPAVTSTSDLASKEANVIGKKRLSQDHIESVNKKAKIEKLDKLFGSERADRRKEVMSLPRIPRRRQSATALADEPIKKPVRDPRPKMPLKKSFEKPASRPPKRQLDLSATVQTPITDIQDMLTPISDDENDFSSSSGYERANKLFKSNDERKRSDSEAPLLPNISKLSVPLEPITPLPTVAQSLQIPVEVVPPSTASIIAQEQLKKLQPSFNISIDGILRDVRFYGEVAVAFMGDHGSEPREIGFQAGHRRVLVNNAHTIVLNFNDVYRPFVIGDDILQIRFGTPIRELYINNQWYECFFRESPVVISIDGKQFLMQIEGPPPQIQIGHLRTDLVAGTVNMFIDTINKVPLFLDCQLQYFMIDDQLHTIQFADYLLTVLIDGEAFPVEYGTMPKRFRIGGIERHIRFSVLPIGLKAGYVSLVNMRRTGRPGVSTPPPVVIKTDVEKPVLPQAAASMPSLNIDDLLQQLVASGLLNSNSQGATVDEPDKKPKESEKPNKTERSERSERSSQPKASSLSAKHVDLSKTKSIKQRFSENIEVLFTGLQCASCGVRFASDQAVKYSQHLDWHFRQNRREKELARRAQSRPWYYKVTDWIQYEEIEDLDEREKNWFEHQASASGEAEIGSEDSAEGCTSQQQAPAEQLSSIPSCVAGPSDTDKTCDMCHDPFDTFYNEDMEEWHLQNAIRADDSSTYHPACLQEMQAKEEASKNASVISDGFDDNAVDNAIGQAEEEHIILDDDVVEIPSTEELVTEIPDEDDNKDIVRNLILPIPTIVSEEFLIYEPIGDESDIQILVPQVDTLNLDEYEEKVLPEAPAESLPVIIKAEPIDEGYKDVDNEEDYEDLFEEVGILLEEIAAIEAADPSEHPTSDDQREKATSPALSPTPQITQMDGNVEPELENVYSVSTNKIKININKNVSKIVAKSSDENTENLNEPTASGTEPRNAPLAIADEPEIVFDYKNSMEGISFQKSTWTGGRETSGLCSIM